MQPDFTQIETVVAELSDPKALDVLRGKCKELDKYFDLVGVESVAAILAGSLHNIFERDRDVFRRTQLILAAVLASPNEERPDRELEMLASLLAEIIDKNDDLRGEINAILRKATWKMTAKMRRKGESNIFTQLEDKRQDEILVREYSEIETKLFNRLKDEMRMHVLPPLSSQRARVPDSHQALRTPDNQRPVHNKSGQLDTMANDAESSVLTWSEMQVILNGLGPTFFSGDWQKEPRKTLLWIWQNGTHEQWCVYVYNNAGMIDDELRSLFLKALAEEGEIPTVWRTILIRALSRPRNVPQG
jgi:hypothetical protein